MAKNTRLGIVKQEMLHAELPPMCQTTKPKTEGISNCPYCAQLDGAAHTKIWELKDMDADHVTAWSKGGATDPANCQMLCKMHNKMKGNA